MYIRCILLYGARGCLHFTLLMIVTSTGQLEIVLHLGVCCNVYKNQGLLVWLINHSGLEFVLFSRNVCGSCTDTI